MPVTRRLLRVSLGLLLVAGVGVGVVYAVRPVRPTRERFTLVKEGMTRKEVERIVGGPLDDYARGRSYRGTVIVPRKHLRAWVCEEGELLVSFDGQSRADFVIVLDVDEVDRPGWWERMRYSLGL